jgi:hypothetical protein
VEALVGGEWIHVDPCEAAVDEPLLYQGWGKNQTFIFSFERRVEGEQDGDKAVNVEVEDVTWRYTTNATAVFERRLLEGVNQSYVNTVMQETPYFG